MVGCCITYVALYKISGVKASPLAFGVINQVAVGDEVYVIGNPQGLEGTFSQGIVSSIRQVGSDILFQITAPISPGSSGGPVLNAQGKVIGIAVATFSGGQNLNFAIPVSYLATLLSELKPVVPLSAKTTTKQEKSMIDDFGGRNVEGIIGGQLRWEAPAWEYEGRYYTFSLRNQLHELVKDVYCLVVFYDRSDNPIDVNVVRYNGIIPPGLAKRVTGNQVHKSVRELTTDYNSLTPSTKVEFRILDFKIID